jgi:hypothetical protein
MFGNRSDRYEVGDVVKFRIFDPDFPELVEWAEVVDALQQNLGTKPYRVTNIEDTKFKAHPQFLTINDAFTYSGWWFEPLR